jgi:hypothetical protein
MKHLALLAILLAAACGSKSKTPDTTGGDGTGDRGGTDQGVPSGPLAAGQWETLDDETRAKFMKNVVLPDMKAKFQGFDAEEFAGFDCKTCHGSGVDNGKFEMPNPELPQLSMQEIQAPDEDHKAITEFMMTQVKPGMATLLGLPEYSPETPDGFGCMHCHTMEQ